MTRLPDATPRAGGCWSLDRRRIVVSRPERQRRARPVRGSPPSDRGARRRPPGAHDARGEGRAALPPGADRAGRRLARRRPDPLTGVSARGLVADSGLTHFNIYWGPAGAGRVAQPDAGDRGGDTARHPDHPLLRPAARPRRTLRRAWPARASRSGPTRSGWRRRGTKASCASSPTSRAASTSRWASAWRSTRRPISRPSRAGAAQPGRSARTRRSRRAWWPPTSGACRARRSARRASRA